MCSVFFFFKRWLGCVMLLRKLLFFPASFFLFFSRQGLQFSYLFLSASSLFFSLSRAPLLLRTCVFFFPCALYPRDVETVICTYAHSRIYCPIIHFFFHGSELNCFCIYSFLHALTFFFFWDKDTRFCKPAFFFFVLFVPFSQLHWKFAYPFFRLLVSSSVSEKQHTSIYLSLSSPSQLRKEDKKKKRNALFFSSSFFVFTCRTRLASKTCLLERWTTTLTRTKSTVSGRPASLPSFVLPFPVSSLQVKPLLPPHTYLRSIDVSTIFHPFIN